jgi:hypothetical protein
MHLINVLGSLRGDMDVPIFIVTKFPAGGTGLRDAVPVKTLNSYYRGTPLRDSCEIYSL